MRFFYLVFILFAVSSTTLAVDYCEIRAHQQKIFLLGWQHLLESDQINFYKTLQALQQNDCVQSATELQTYLSTAKSQLAEAERVLQELQKTYTQTPFKKIGLEYTPQEWSQIFDSSAKSLKIETQLQNIENTCPDLKNQMQSFRKIINPAYYFVQQNQLELVPLEEDAVKNKIKRSIAQESLNYDAAREGLTAKAYSLFLHAVNKNKNGEKISEQEFSAIALAETNPNKRQKLQKALNETALLLNSQNARDEAIVANIKKSTAPMLVLIGQSHIKNISAQLSRNCEVFKN